MAEGMNIESPTLTANNEQIDWLLSRPNMSPWLKNALTTARGRNPVDLLNDLDILDYLLRTRSNAQIRSALEGYAQGTLPG
ncbi:hypothetical protein [Mesorhizobium sp. Root157]|uniref:hypothetical protein n=1 Tax=Mesorhizobium sp. Root157 TaxID=1736477 RepID=UPI000A546261|nr:hypothetical protein [Mesorhizobium sp. Root157]